MKTIDLLQAQFPGRVLIPASTAGKALGYAESSVRNMLYKGTFPLKTVKLGDKRMVSVLELAAHIDSLKPTSNRGRGRPRKSAPIPASSELPNAPGVYSAASYPTKHAP